jgi:hypothetical protein
LVSDIADGGVSEIAECGLFGSDLMQGAGAAGSLIAEDIPCMECQYDLRGLNVPGKCPECGHDLAESITTYREERLPVTRWWAKQMIEATTLSAIALFLMVLPLMLPDSMANFHTFGRKVLLGIASTAWVLAFYSIWKFTRRENLPKERGQFYATRLITRIFAILYGLAPLLFAVSDYFRDVSWSRWAEPFLFAVVSMLGICGLCTELFLFANLRNIAWRIHSRSISMQALILGVLSPFAFIMAVATMFDRGGSSSLDFMTGVPVYYFGSRSAFYESTWMMRQGQMPHPLSISSIAFVLWVLVLFVELAFRVGHAAKVK